MIPSCRRKALYTLLAAYITSLAAFYIYNAIGLAAPSYRIRAYTVDPRDLLRGNYATLRYEISEMPETFRHLFSAGDKLYVILKQDAEGFWVTHHISAQPPSPSPYAPYIRGWYSGFDIKFDMEKYFIPEDSRALPYELIAEIAIDSKGQGRIKRIFPKNSHPQ
ncbi:MAG: GDYXXLXY domain-containing protein [Methylacidiphilales bacterium]|nr:GDYXXLXY domain-containing protein [Candidatus Methylacidiphilales bacterium]MDW8349560.1 GDYXXLXY domain-containing protein [Verrucomicrobiae bacterium]